MHITKNPADDLAQHVEKGFAQRFGGKHNIGLMTRKCLPVKQSDVEKCVGDFEIMINDELARNKNHTFLVIHIGVNAGLSSGVVAFEQNCFNCKDFDPNSSPCAQETVFTEMRFDEI
jgi:hypothetical protein